MSYKGYEAVIGLEIHAQFKTASKMFCGDSTAFDAGDNENTSPISVGMPGTLPVINKKAIDFAIKTGLALNCEVRRKSVFSRKNYFYPDLPKGYQISQYDLPICEHGFVNITLEGQEKKISITRAHLEEDAGKSTHQGNFTLLNYNRSGIPLLEIVSGPDMKTGAEAGAYARTVRQILRYLDVCDGNLEEGSMRCDCNVSVRKVGVEKFGTKVEIKNVNSFRFVEKAIDYEIERQVEAIESGEKIVQETRLYDPDKNRTFTMRTKEDAQDYRYFPDPDLLPVIVTDKMVTDAKETLPELPRVRRARFMAEYNLPEYDSDILIGEKELADYFEKVIQICKNPKVASNWIMTELLRELNQAELTIVNSPISANHFGQMIQFIEDGTISGKMGKAVFAEMWKTSKDPESIIKEKGLVQITDTSAIEKIIEDVLASSANSVAEYKAGKTKLMGFFVGQIMKASKGQANPELVNKILIEKLNK
jgi:aspartyl-tRNA(Asn)/glutamyl-tRNA(Gln) amidotransferase subunit B